jgi:hypothetical protein
MCGVTRYPRSPRSPQSRSIFDLLLTTRDVRTRDCTDATGARGADAIDFIERQAQRVNATFAVQKREQKKKSGCLKCFADGGVNRRAVYVLTLSTQSARSPHDSGRFISW